MTGGRGLHALQLMWPLSLKLEGCGPPRPYDNEGRMEFALRMCRVGLSSIVYRPKTLCR